MELLERLEEAVAHTVAIHWLLEESQRQVLLVVLALRLQPRQSIA
jgi:hypothetical protein